MTTQFAAEYQMRSAYAWNLAQRKEGRVMTTTPTESVDEPTTSDLAQMRADMLAETIAANAVTSWDIRLGENFFVPREGLVCALCRSPFLKNAIVYGYWNRWGGREFLFAHRFCHAFARDNGRAPRDDDSANGWEPK